VRDPREAVRRRLGPLDMDAGRAEEIIAELADHVSDLAEEWLRRGATAEEAMGHALSSIPDWDGLRLEIRYAEQEEDIMSYRVKALWLPAVCTTTLSMALFQLAQWAWPLPHSMWLWRGVALFLYWPWLLCLPFIGAFGAYWSRRAGGRLLERAFAGAFPALGLICFLALFSSWVLVFNEGWSHRPPLVPLVTFVLSCAVFPGLALLLGALPFLKGSQHEPARDGTSG